MAPRAVALGVQRAEGTAAEGLRSPCERDRDGRVARFVHGNRLRETDRAGNSAVAVGVRLVHPNRRNKPRGAAARAAGWVVKLLRALLRARTAKSDIGRVSSEEPALHVARGSTRRLHGGHCGEHLRRWSEQLRALGPEHVGAARAAGVAAGTDERDGGPVLGAVHLRALRELARSVLVPRSHGTRDLLANKPLRGDARPERRARPGERRGTSRGFLGR